MRIVGVRLIHGKPIWKQEALGHPTKTMVNSIVTDAVDLKCDELAFINFTIICRILSTAQRVFNRRKRLSNPCFENWSRKIWQEGLCYGRRLSMGAKKGLKITQIGVIFLSS